MEIKKEFIAISKGYFVSKQGVVYSPKGNVLKLSTARGYSKFEIRINGEKASIRVHRLQAFQKFGSEIYKEGVEVRHFNGIPLDNSWENILIGTRSENQMDIPKLVRNTRGLTGTKEIIKYPFDQVLEIRKYREDGHSYKEIMERYNITDRSTVSYLINKRVM